MADHYDIYFSGQVMDGQDPDQVRANIGQLFIPRLWRDSFQARR